MNINWNDFRDDVTTVWFDEDGKCHAHGDGMSYRIPALDNAVNAGKTFTRQRQVQAKEIDWSLVPDWAEYVAMDADGWTDVYSGLPVIHECELSWSANGHQREHIAELNDYIDRSQWRSSLARRPATTTSAAPHDNKYQRTINGAPADVYDVLKAFGVTNPAAQHAIKKLLLPGGRGHKSKEQDYREARASVDRAIELEGDE